MIPTLARRLFLAALAAAPISVGLMDTASAAVLQQAAFERTPSGVVVTPQEGPARRVRLEVYGPETIRVTATEDAHLQLPPSLMVTAQPNGAIAIAEIEPGQFILAGHHIRIDFAPKPSTDGKRRMVLRVEEGRFDDAGNWVFERIWNGDQVDYGLNFTDRPQLLRVVTATY